MRCRAGLRVTDSSSASGFQCDWRQSQASAGGSAALRKLIGSQACWPRPPAHPPPRRSRSPTARVHAPSREALRSSGGHTRVRPAANRAESGGREREGRSGGAGPLGRGSGGPWSCSGRPGSASLASTAEETALTSGPRTMVQPTLLQPEVWALTEVVAGRT